MQWKLWFIIYWFMIFLLLYQLCIDYIIIHEIIGNIVFDCRHRWWLNADDWIERWWQCDWIMARDDATTSCLISSNYANLFNVYNFPIRYPVLCNSMLLNSNKPSVAYTITINPHNNIFNNRWSYSWL